MGITAWPVDEREGRRGLVHGAMSQFASGNFRSSGLTLVVTGTGGRRLRQATACASTHDASMGSARGWRQGLGSEGNGARYRCRNGQVVVRRFSEGVEAGTVDAVQGQGDAPTTR